MRRRRRKGVRGGVWVRRKSSVVSTGILLVFWDLRQNCHETQSPGRVTDKRKLRQTDTISIKCKQTLIQPDKQTLRQTDTETNRH